MLKTLALVLVGVLAVNATYYGGGYKGFGRRIGGGFGMGKGIWGGAIGGYGKGYRVHTTIRKGLYLICVIK